MNNRIAIITPSFNKHEYVKDAIRSVLDQTYRDFTYWIIDNSTDDKTWGTILDYFAPKPADPRVVIIREEIDHDDRSLGYPTARILNKYFDLIDADIFVYLSDDDLLHLSCLERIIKKFETNPDALAVYFTMQSHDMHGNQHGTLYALDTKTRGMNLDCMLDSGQVAFRKELLARVPKPYYEIDWAKASHCDGLFLTKLCSQADLLPINEMLVLHRRTAKSTFINS